MLERPILRVGNEIFLCFSPERVDPGNPHFQTKNIPKVVGGTTPECTELGMLLYAQALDKVVPVSATQVAEMVKLLDKMFRMINIGLVNELAVMCGRMGIDVWEVIDAAATKPFGFMLFYPGPGLGGHCIPIDPFYLSWKSKQAGIEARFIELAGYINGANAALCRGESAECTQRSGQAAEGSHVHILGIAYKRDIDDMRESPALDVAHLLLDRGAKVTYSDPFVPMVQVDHHQLFSQDIATSCGEADCVVIITNHSDFPYASIVEELAPDCRHTERVEGIPLFENRSPLVEPIDRIISALGDVCERSCSSCWPRLCFRPRPLKF